MEKNVVALAFEGCVELHELHGFLSHKVIRGYILTRGGESIVSIIFGILVFFVLPVSELRDEKIDLCFIVRSIEFDILFVFENVIHTTEKVVFENCSAAGFIVKVVVRNDFET